MATPNPVAVVIRACAIPEVTVLGSAIPPDSKNLNDIIMPVTVPKIPRSGDSVIIVSPD